MNKRPGKRGPRIPTWLLVTAVVGLFATATLLFFTGDDDSGAPATPTTTDRSTADDVLELPDEEDGQDTDARRRGELGRDRLDDEGNAAKDTTDPDDELSADAQKLGLPATAANLRGRTITIVPASARSAESGAKPVTIAGVRTTCARERDANSLAVELSLAARIDSLIDAAGATPRRIDAERTHDLACPSKRLADQEASDIVVVLEVEADDPQRVIAGRAVGKLPAAEQATAKMLAAELAAALDVDSTAPKRSDAQLLTDRGALDAPGGATVVYVRMSVDDDADLDALALRLVSALAAAATVQEADADRAPSTD